MKIIAGPCAIEGWKLARETAQFIDHIRSDFPQHEFVYKSSYDKANRTSISSRRGVGMIDGLEILQRVKKEYGLNLTTDVHETHEVNTVAQVVDEIQIPALLSRQTNLVVEAAKTGKWVNIKRAQTTSGKDAAPMIEKCHSVNNKKVQMIERGTTVLNDFVIDWRNVLDMQRLDCDVIVDVTHPHGPKYALDYARMARAIGVNGIFAEIHPFPDKAHSDGSKMLDFRRFRILLEILSY
tara:strand:+ start:700 stop:1413 length:714 start_codon:yes stop_codon:yes gene_type:complete